MGSAVSLRQRLSSRGTLPGHNGCINTLCVSDGYIITASEKNSCCIWDKWTLQLVTQLQGHTKNVSCLATTENFVISGSADTTLRKWHIQTGDCLLTFEGHWSAVNNVKICTTLLYSTSLDKTARQWDLNTGDCLRIYQGHDRIITSILLCHLPVPGKILQRRKSLTNVFIKKKSTTTISMYHETLLITGSIDKTVKSFSTKTGVIVHNYELAEEGGVTCLAEHSKLHQLYIGSKSGSIGVWDIESGHCLQALKGHQGAVSCLEIYEGYLYSGSEDGMSRMWNCRTGICERVFQGHTMTVTCIVCTRELLCTAGKDGFIMIWHCGQNNYGYKKCVRAHTYPITQLVVSGQELMSASYDCTVKIWKI